MKKLLTSTILAFILLRALAQSPVPAQLPKEVQPDAYVHAIQVELPQVECKYSLPLKEAGIGNLPNGANLFFQSPQPGFSPVVINYTFRPFALVYKDKIGVAFYYNGFGAYLDMNGFNRYMVSHYAGQYSNVPDISSLTTLYFEGPAIGIAWRLHYRSFTIEPNFIFGFEHLSNVDLATEEILKQNGSNQFLDYQLTTGSASPRQHSYRPRLQLGRRCHFKKVSTVFELGLVFDYIYSPYAYNLTISQITYGNSPAIQQVTVRTAYRQYNFGFYLRADLHQPRNR